MPNIKSLEISLSDEEDVSFIILNMPQLEELNQIKVDRTQSSENNEDSLDSKPVEKDQKIKKQPFEMKEIEEVKEDDFFENNFRKDDSHSEFKISPVHINLELSNTPNLRIQDMNIQQHLNIDIISDIETTLKINQKSIQESMDDGLIDFSEISSSNIIKRKKKSERKNKSQSRLSSNLRQSKIKDKQNFNSIESPNKLKQKVTSNQSPSKEQVNQKENIDYKEQKEQSPLSKSQYYEENSDNQINQIQIETKNFMNQNFENNYVTKKNSSKTLLNAQKPKYTQIIKTKSDQISLEEPITVEQIKNQDTKESNYKISSKETEQNDNTKTNIFNLNKDLKGVSDISLQLLNQNLQSPEKYLKFTQMLYNQEKTQDSNTFQSAHHMESQEELQKMEQQEILSFDEQQQIQMQQIELQFNQQNFQNQFFPIRQLNQQQLENECLIVENILQEDNEDMSRTPNQLSDIIEDEREAEIENGLSKGTCNFGNSYSRANNSVLGQTQQVQSVNSSQSLAQQISLHGIGIGLKEFSSTMQSYNKERLQIQKFKEDKNIQLNNEYSQQNYSFKQELLNPVLQSKLLNEEKENIIVLHQSQNPIQNIQSPKMQISFSAYNQDLQEQEEQDIIIQSSRKLQKFIDEKRVKEKIQNQENPTLKPTDLEDLANIFDKIRVLFKKKSSSNQPQPKKLILKNVGPTDDLAIQFDQKLTEIMFQLSKILKDNLVTSYQKNAEIEKSKFLLYIYCNQTCIKFISKYKGNILQKDAKEVEIILQKLNDIFSHSFVKLASTFYTKEDKELKMISQMQIENLQQECINFDQVQQKYELAIQELSQNKIEMFNLKESYLNQSIRLEEQHYQLRKSEENFNELMYAREEIIKLRQQMANYEQILCENQQIKNELYRLKEFVQDQNKLKKNVYSKEKECQKLKKIVSHLQEEIREMKEEGTCLFDENQKYLDMIVRYSLGQEKGQNGGMKVNLDWLKSRILRKKKSIYDGHSAFDGKSYMSQSNLSVSPILRSQKFNQLSIGLKNSKKNKKLNDMSIRSIKSQNSSGSQKALQKDSKTVEIELNQNRRKSIEDFNEKNKYIKNTSKSSKFGEKLGQANEAVYPKEGGYSNIHSYRKSFKKSPINNDFNLSFQQSKDRQKSQVYNPKIVNLQERGYDKDMESEKSNYLIKSQNSQKSQDVYQNKQGEEKEELQKTAAKKLQKVESQLIEKSYTKEILGIQKKIISPNKYNEIEQMNKQQQPISVEDCEPSPCKYFKNSQKNLNLNNIQHQNQQLFNLQNELKLRQGSIKNSNISIETSENEQFLKQEKEVQMSLQIQNINTNSNKKVPNLNLNEYDLKYSNQYVQQKHQRTYSASNYSVGYFKNGLHENHQTQPLNNNQNVFTKRSKSISPKHNKDILTINTKNNLFEYNLTYNNQQSAQSQLQLQEVIRRKLQQIDMFKSSIVNSSIYDKLNQNDYHLKSPEIYKIRDFQPIMQQQKEMLSPDIKKNGIKSCKYSLKQIRELITDIYIQKVKHDDKCINMIHQNRETMQQFLCTYLNQKYGLKQIVHEQANAIIQAIADYQFIDHDVLLFKKVLRNQLDEEFRYVQITIKNTVYQLLKTFLSQKYPAKISHDIQKMIVDIENGKNLIDNWLWQKILNQMYDKTDQFIIYEKLKKMENLFQMEKQYISESKSPHPVLATNLRAESRKRSKELTGRRSIGFNRNSVCSQNIQNQSDCEKQQKDGNKKLSKYTNNHITHPKYQFQIFMETILLFQLNEHEKFLQKFMQLFQSIDTVQSGVITNQQFIQLCQKMKVHNNEIDNQSKYQDEINQLLDIIDPYQSNKITLSDIILLFSKHNLNMLEGNILKSSNKKQNVNIDYSVQGLNKLNDLEKSQSFNLNLSKKNVDPQLEQFNQFQVNSEQNQALMNNNEYQKQQCVYTNIQKQILKQKLGDLQQIDETTESNMIFTAENSRQASNQVSMVEKSNNYELYNIMNQCSIYNQGKQNEGKDTMGSMETINKISEDEKRIQYEIMMLEKQLENKI